MPGARAALPLLAAAAWVACELGRGRLFTGSPVFIGNPWALLGYSQVGWDAVTQVAALSGVYGIGFAVAAVNAGLAEGWLLLRGRGMTARDVAVGGVASLMPVLASLAYGVAVLPVDADGAEENQSEAVPIAIVQGNLSTGSRWSSDLYGENLETYLRLTLRAIRESAPEVVFWPEAAMTFSLENEPLYRRSIASVLQPFGVELVAGGTRWESDADASAYFNTIFAVSPPGEIVDRYDKQYLVPFAEHFPLRSIEFLRRSFERVRVFQPGRSPAPLETRLGPAGVVTCNEAMLPEVVGERVAEGAVVLVNPSNDTWIPEPRFAELQFDIVSLRAVEQRRWLVRASTAGPSAIIDPWGRVQARTAMDERTTLQGSVAPRTGRTLYSRVGDLFAFACVGLVAGVCVAPVSWARHWRSAARRASDRSS